MTIPRDSSSLEEEAAEALEVVLTRAAYDVVGVTDVFAPTTISQMPQIVAALVAGEPERFNRVRATSHPTGVDIDVRIGVDSDASAAEAARGVADVLLQLGAGSGEIAVRVQVSRLS